MRATASRSRLQRRQDRAGYLFCLPLIFGMIFLFIIPVMQTVVYSFSETTLSSTGISLKWGGLTNYRDVLLVDPVFREQVLLSIGDMLLNLLLIVVFSFFVATLLNQRFRGRAAVRVIFFLPLVMASSALMSFDTGDVLQNLMGSSGGFKDTDAAAGAIQSAGMAMTLMRAGIPDTAVEYLLAAADRIYEIVILSGVQILMFLSALQSVSPSLYEAADIDGATAWEKYWKITFPMLSQMIVLVVLYTVIDSFVQSETITLIHDKMFKLMNYGAASAMSVVYFVLVMAIIGLIYLAIRRIAYCADE